MADKYLAPYLEEKFNLRRKRITLKYMGDERKLKEVLESANKSINDIDEIGLDGVDRKMLKTMIENFKGKPVGLDTLGAVTGEEPDTIEDVYEPYLMQIGFLARTPRGRIVTQAGLDHLGIELNDCNPQIKFKL